MNLIRVLIHLPRLASRAGSSLMNPRVPLRLKIIVAVVALFIISPLNILGDIPLLGMFDDIALLGFLADWFVKATAAYAPADPAAGPFGESIEPTRPPLSWPRNQ